MTTLWMVTGFHVEDGGDSWVAGLFPTKELAEAEADLLETMPRSSGYEPDRIFEVSEIMVRDKVSEIVSWYEFSRVLPYDIVPQPHDMRTHVHHRSTTVNDEYSGVVPAQKVEINFTTKQRRNATYVAHLPPNSSSSNKRYVDVPCAYIYIVAADMASLKSHLAASLRIVCAERGWWDGIDPDAVAEGVEIK